MIPYTRTQWYGWAYFLRWHGSVLMRVMPMAAFSAAIAVLVHEGYLDIGGGKATKLMGHPYSMQLFGMVFGFLTVSRINISYQRYWEGVTVVKTMHSKWTDACGQVLNFDSVKSHSTDRSDEPFCRHIVRLFSQMSALATLRLHIEDPIEKVAFENLACGRKPTDTAGKSRAKAAPAKVAPRQGTGSGVDPSLAVLVRQGTRHEDFKLRSGALLQLNARERSEVEELLAGITPEEARILCAAACPVTATAQRIQRAIITRQNAGGMNAPPPIVSRIFQEISNGLLAYNNATKMKEIPVPFAYVQFNAAVITLFAVLAPYVIACFTDSALFAGIFSAVVVGCFYALFIVANEMEDPFGDDPNDMPMFAYHEEFCSTVYAMLTVAWASTDQWTVASGEWVDPRPPADPDAQPAPWVAGLAASKTHGLLDAAKARKITAKRTALGTQVRRLVRRKPAGAASAAQAKPWKHLVTEATDPGSPLRGQSA